MNLSNSADSAHPPQNKSNEESFRSEKLNAEGTSESNQLWQEARHLAQDAEERVQRALRIKTSRGREICR